MGTIYLADGDDLTSVANAIRTKSGGSSQLAFPAGFVSEIGSITNLTKKSITFTKTANGRTQTITNPLSPLIPKVIIVQANMNDFPSSPTSGVVSSTGVTLVGPQSSSESYNFYNNNVSYYNSSGTLTVTYSYTGDYRNRISLDGSTIIVGVRSQTGSTFLANVEYTIDLYYW